MMKLSKHKKGLMWGLIVAFIVCFVVAGVLFGVAGKWKKLGDVAVNMSHFGLAGGDAPNTFLFEAESLSIVTANNNNCQADTSTGNTADAVNNRFICKPNINIDFETEISNGGAAQRRFYGGIIVCELTCKKRLFKTTCELADKTCVDRIIDSLSGTCTVKKAETGTCDAGSYTFKPGIYSVAPVATCVLDNTYGCYQVGMSKAQSRSNANANLIVTVS